jgi:GNAT acetyltransferase
MSDEVLQQVRSLWMTLAGAEGSLSNNTVTVVGPGGVGICPAGWVGIVLLGGSLLVQAPSSMVDAVEARLHESMKQGDLKLRFGEMASLMGSPQSVLGPAALFYGSAPSPCRSVHATTGPVDVLDSSVQELLDSAPRSEVDESDLASADSGIILALDENRRAMSASGYKQWPCGIAHVGVITRPSARGQRYGWASAAAVINLATQRGLLAQWRAAESNLGSIALAESLGLARLGRQLSFRPPAS